MRLPPTRIWSACTQMLPPYVPRPGAVRGADLTSRSDLVTLLFGHVLLMPTACGRWLSSSARNRRPSGTCRSPAFSSSSLGLCLLAAESRSCASAACTFSVTGSRCSPGGPAPLLQRCAQASVQPNRLTLCVPAQEHHFLAGSRGSSAWHVAPWVGRFVEWRRS